MSCDGETFTMRFLDGLEELLVFHAKAVQRLIACQLPDDLQNRGALGTVSLLSGAHTAQEIFVNEPAGTRGGPRQHLQIFPLHRVISRSLRYALSLALHGFLHACHAATRALRRLAAARGSDG